MDEPRWPSSVRDCRRPTTTDKPRQVIIVHPDVAREMQRTLVERGVTDVLVKPDTLGVIKETTEAIVMNPPHDLQPIRAWTQEWWRWEDS